VSIHDAYLLTKFDAFSFVVVELEESRRGILEALSNEPLAERFLFSVHASKLAVEEKEG